MNDSQIVNMYWERNEKAIEETQKKYGKFCYSVAYSILCSEEDAKESVNDTYLDAWNSIPPHKPSVLSAFLGKITRRISIDKWRNKNAARRGGGQITDTLDELAECIPDSNGIEKQLEEKALNETINSFIKSLPKKEQKIFICRYWYLDSIKSISEQFGFSQSKVTSMLFRTREKLRKILMEEGFI